MYDLWLWPLILGIFLIILSGLLAGGLHETNHWIWAAFIAGAILTLIGVILGIIAWSKEIKVNQSSVSINTTTRITPTSPTSPITPINNTNLIMDPPSLEDVAVTSTNMPVIPAATLSPINYNEYRYASPIGSPTPLKINIPQAQRGFTPTNIQLSSLAPDTLL